MSQPPHNETPNPAVAVSPTDQSSDREQSDQDQEGNLGRNVEDRAQADANQAVTVEKLDTLINTNESLAGASTAVARAIRSLDRAVRTNHHRYVLTIVGLVSVMCVGFASIGVALYQGAKSRQQIADCITPGGRCFQSSATRTADLINNLNKVTELATACAPDYVALPFTQREAAIRACIIRGLSK